MEAIGILKVKGESQQVSEKFKKREFVITDNGSKYPQHISFQLSQDKCDIIDTYNVGDEIKVQFNLQGREWTSPKGEVKYFNTLDAWKVQKLGAGESSNNSGQATATASSSEGMSASSSEEDLPF